MAVTPLKWNDGEGYDIHVLRGGPASKPLDQSLHVDAQFPLAFEPHFKGAPNSQALGVQVDTATGAVTATAPAAGQGKLRNFLMTAFQDLGAGNRAETVIRVHIHDSIQKIWPTPATLNVHRGSDERRFTVLALFDDGVIGDITDWQQLHYTSANVSAVTVANVGDPDPLSPRPVSVGGVYTVVTLGGQSVITVELNLDTPPTQAKGTATVVASRPWLEGGQRARIRFLSGPVYPSPDEPDPDKFGSVESVVANAPNILFVAEGFTPQQKGEFDKMVRTIVGELRNKDYVLPFKLLSESINYWSVFVPSRETAINVLGDQAISRQISALSFPVPLPHAPDPNAAEWTVPNMVHQGGLPAPHDPSTPNPAAWVADRARFYDLPANAPNSPRITQQALDVWNALSSRALLNERSTHFGLAHCDRPRASRQDQSEWRLLLDERRTSEDSFLSFVDNLTFSKNDGSTFEIGHIWRWESGTNPNPGKDRGLVCLVCRDDTRGATWAPAGPTPPYFAACPGQTELTGVTAAANGQDISSLTTPGFSASLLASRVARGIARAFGLGDEYGDDPGSSPVTLLHLTAPNLQQADTGLVTGAPGTAPRVIDATKTKWIWPRIVNAVLMDVQFDANGALTSPQKCDPNGTPNANGSHLLVKLRFAPPAPFAKNDVVRVREAVNLTGARTWLPPSEDNFAGFALFVEQVVDDTTLVLGYSTSTPPQPGYVIPNATQINLVDFSQLNLYTLISPLIEAGSERPLVAEPIRTQIDTSDSPLNAGPGSHGANCVPGSPPFDRVSATNLPQGLKILPYPLADTLGIYEGGGRVDCDVFRPAGRCRMRAGFETTTPFCYVCAYILVDLIDPSKHGELDKLYPEVKA
jgi:hypothetical protein